MYPSSSSSRYVIFALGLFCHQIGLLRASSSSSSVCTCECPNFNCFNVDLINAPECDDTCLRHVEKLWSSTYPVLTEYGNDLKEALLVLAKSEVPYWRNTAIIASSWIWSSITAIEYEPVFCAFTQLINATVDSFYAPIDCCALNDAAQSLSDTVVDAMRYATAAALRDANCCDKCPEPVMSRCYKDGSVYPIYEYWNRVGNLYPYIYQKAVMKLYNSNCYLDRFMCAVATAATTEHLKTFFANFNKQGMLDVLQTQRLGPIDPDSCDKLESDLDQITYMAKCWADLAAYKMLEASGCQ